MVTTGLRDDGKVGFDVCTSRELWLAFLKPWYSCTWSQMRIGFFIQMKLMDFCQDNTCWNYLSLIQWSFTHRLWSLFNSWIREGTCTCLRLSCTEGAVMRGEKEMIGTQSLGGEEVLSGVATPGGHWVPASWKLGAPRGGRRWNEKKQVLWSSRTALRWDGKNPGEEAESPVIWAQRCVIQGKSHNLAGLPLASL